MKWLALMLLVSCGQWGDGFTVNKVKDGLFLCKAHFFSKSYTIECHGQDAEESCYEKCVQFVPDYLRDKAKGGKHGNTGTDRAPRRAKETGADEALKLDSTGGNSGGHPSTGLHPGLRLSPHQSWQTLRVR